MDESYQLCEVFHVANTFGSCKIGRGSGHSSLDRELTRSPRNSSHAVTRAGTGHCLSSDDKRLSSAEAASGYFTTQCIVKQRICLRGRHNAVPDRILSLGLAAQLAVKSTQPITGSDIGCD